MDRPVPSSHWGSPAITHVAKGFAASVSSPPEACPCGGGAYALCCAPLIRGQQLASTAEQLMRSRYSAFALAGVESGAIDHLLRTHPEPGFGERERRRALRAATLPTVWQRLIVLSCEQGGPEDTCGMVHFQAHWSSRGRSGVLDERSRFGRGPQGQWLYLEALV